MQEHSPFEPGYIGNHDPSGPVAVLDVTFPRDRLLKVGAAEGLVDRMTADLDEIEPDERRRVIEALDSLDDTELVEALAAAEEEYARQDAYATLPEEDRAALEALSQEDQEALAGLSDDDRAALTGATGEPPVEPVPTGTVEAVLAWVGDDRERAARALAEEEQSDDPRVTLVKPLQDLLAHPGDAAQ